jgi:nucleoid-associated protein YgaU
MRRPVLAALACATALLFTACFGGGSAQPTTQPTTTSPTTTAISPAAPKVPSPSPSVAALPSPSPSQPRASGPEQTYTVEAGDTLAKIAQKYYGDETLWRMLYDANRGLIGDNPDNIKVGTQIKIPPKD